MKLPSAPPPPGYVADFFEHLFGFKERDLSYGEVQAQFAAEDGGSTLVSNVNGRRFQAGTFTCPTLRELRECARRYAKTAGSPDNAEGPPLIVRHVTTHGAMEDHADPSNAGALFQVASQFNCLEFTSKAGTPEKGVTVYARDPTQGPSCAIACVPGAIYRNYLLPLPVDGDTQQCGQTAGMQLDTLKGVASMLGNDAESSDDGKGKYFWLENGYIVSDRGRLQALTTKLNDLGEAGRDEIRGALMVGLTTDAEVVVYGSKRSSKLMQLPFFQVERVHAEESAQSSMEAAPSLQQRVSQIYSAAANVISSDTSVQDWEPFARLILEATYEAVLWAAVKHVCEQKLEEQSGNVVRSTGAHFFSLQWPLLKHPLLASTTVANVGRCTSCGSHFCRRWCLWKQPRMDCRSNQSISCSGCS